LRDGAIFNGVQALGPLQRQRGSEGEAPARGIVQSGSRRHEAAGAPGGFVFPISEGAGSGPRPQCYEYDFEEWMPRGDAEV
jgi:hypothetical protein